MLVENMSFKGLMQVKIKLITSFPHIQTVGVSFMQPPEFDFVLKPIGGETFGFEWQISFLVLKVSSVHRARKSRTNVLQS